MTRGRSDVRVHGWVTYAIHVSVLCTIPAWTAPTRSAAQPPGWAEPRVLVVRAAEERVERSEALAQEVARELRAAGVPIHRPPAPPGPSAPPPAELLAEALTAYHNLQPEEAARRLNLLTGRLDASGGAGTTRSTIIDAWLATAMVAQARADPAEVQRALERVLAVEPNLEIDLTRYPPTLDALLTEQRAAERDAPVECTLIVKTVSPATIAVDGTTWRPGQTQAVVSPGVHLVRVEATGYEPEGRAVTVDAPSATTVFELKPDPAARLRQPGPPEGDVSRLAAAASALGQTLLLIDVRDASGAVGLEARDSASKRRASLRTPSPLPVQRAASELVARLLPPAILPARPSVEDNSSDFPWLWVGAGATVAVALAATVAVLAANSGSDSAFARWSRADE